jgi:hypothetical protein
MRFQRILLVCAALALLAGVSGNVVAKDGGAPLPIPPALADGGAPLPIPPAIADGGAPLPIPPAYLDGGAPLPIPPTAV